MNPRFIGAAAPLGPSGLKPSSVSLALGPAPITSVTPIYGRADTDVAEKHPARLERRPTRLVHLASVVASIRTT